VAHDLKYWSWETRPRNNVAGMIRDLKNHLAKLFILNVAKGSEVTFPYSKDFAGKNILLRYNKQFFPGPDREDPDIGKIWLHYTVGEHDPNIGYLSFTVPPLLFILRGDSKTLDPKLTTQTVLYLHLDKEKDPRGFLNERGQFTSESHFNSGAQPTLLKPFTK